MNTVRKERQSNMELLRILSMTGVIVLHFNFSGNSGGGVQFAESITINAVVLYGLENIFICAVNVFLLLSGYFMCTSKSQTLWKPLKLVVQLVFMNIGIYVFSCFVTQNMHFTFKHLVKSCLPCNYFLILYCVLYIISPYINRLLDILDTMRIKRMLFVMLLLFSVYPTAVDLLKYATGMELAGLSSIGIDGSSGGYTIVQFFLMYLTGAYLRKADCKIKGKNLFLAWVLLTGILSGWTYLNKVFGNPIGGVVWEYCNPVVIAEAVVVFLIFKNIKMKNNRIINCLAKETFTVFLLHIQFLLRADINKIVTGNVILMLLWLAALCVGIYLACWCIGFMYNCAADRIFVWLKQRISLPQIYIEEGKKK